MDQNAAATPAPPAPAVEPAPVPTPAAVPPPAARTVATAQRTEREAALEDELQAERNLHARTAEEKKAREMRIAELEDQNFQLKRIVPTPPRKAKSAPLTVWEHFEQGD